MARVTAKFWVYRLYDARGRLLYVGKTADGMQRRLRRHERDNEVWWPLVDLSRTMCTPCESRSAMEAEYIRRHSLKRQPIVNRRRPGLDRPLDGQKAPRPLRDTSVPLAMTSSASDGPAPKPTNAERRTAELRAAEAELGMPAGSAFWNDAGEIDWRL